jgi:hypothetical protein
MLQELHNETARQVSNSSDALTRAQTFERGNDFVRAVDAYLSLTPANVENLDVLQQCWEQVRLPPEVCRPHQIAHPYRTQVSPNAELVDTVLRVVMTMQATTITMQHLRHKLPEVVAAVVQRLVGVGRTAAAADLQEGMNDIAGKYCRLADRTFRGAFLSDHA